MTLGAADFLFDAAIDRFLDVFVALPFPFTVVSVQVKELCIECYHVSIAGLLTRCFPLSLTFPVFFSHRQLNHLVRSQNLTIDSWFHLLFVITLVYQVLLSQENGKVIPEVQSDRCQMWFSPRAFAHDFNAQS